MEAVSVINFELVNDASELDQSKPALGGFYLYLD